LSAKVDSLYNVLKATNQVQNEYIGMDSDGIVYEEYESLYTTLDSIATDDELLTIAKKGNKVIKYHMNAILVDRKSKFLVDLFSQYIYNNEEIYVRGGCTGNESCIAGELYSYIFYQNEKIKSVKYNKENYTAEELKKYHFDSETKWTNPEVDSLLTILNKAALSNDNILPITLRHIFAINKFKFDNYERIKYFANKYPTPEILATLANFQNKKDLPLLHKNIDDAFLAISKFPHPSFIPELKAKVDKGYDDYLYLEAATSFCSKEAEELLTMIVSKFETKRNSKKELDMFDGEPFGHFYNCLEKKNCNFNDSFLLKMWTDNRMISYSFFQKIKDKHYKEILKGYLNNLPFISAPGNEDMDWEKYKDEYEAADGYLCPIILKYLKNNTSVTNDKSIDLDSIECKGYNNR
jgi:hypothetical protein